MNHSTCSSELELNWDPLEASYKDMNVASKSLVSHDPVFNECPLPEDASQNQGGTLVREVFECEETSGECADSKGEVLSPVWDSHEVPDPVPFQSDVPDLIPNQGLKIYFSSLFPLNMCIHHLQL